VKGSCQVTLNGRPYEVGPGDLVFSKPGDTYQLTVDASPGKESADYYLICEGEWITQWIARGGFPDSVRIEVNDDILSLWRRLINEKRNLREDNTEMMDYLLKALCLTLERSVHQRAGQTASSDLYMPYRIKRYVEQHATETLTLEAIAKQASASPTQLTFSRKRSRCRSMCGWPSPSSAYCIPIFRLSIFQCHAASAAIPTSAGRFVPATA